MQLPRNDTPQLATLKFGTRRGICRRHRAIPLSDRCYAASADERSDIRRRRPRRSPSPTLAFPRHAGATPAAGGGSILLLYLLLVVWAGDIFAYFVGKSMGRHLMAPRISPKKTWEGAAASLAASLAVGIVWFSYALQISSLLLRLGLIQRRDGLFGLEKPELWPIVLLTVALNIAAQLGDLVESLIKRGAGVKDSGAILPGHGGMLDRIDALLFAAPVLWVYAIWGMMQ